MKSNPYADLRIDNRADLPAPWYDYPVLQSGEYRTEILYTNGRDYVKVLPGLVGCRLPFLLGFECRVLRRFLGGHLFK